MVDFKVKRGLSTTMFKAPGVINPRLVIEEGTWYLCTDTADLFLGVSENDELILKRINGNGTDINLGDIRFVVEDLMNRVEELEDFSLFQKITNEAELPTNFDDPAFNENVIYYLLKDDIAYTFIFDKDTSSYFCTSANAEPTEITCVTKVEINNQNHLIVTYSDGDIADLGSISTTTVSETSVAIQIGDIIYTDTDGIITLPDFATKDYVDEQINNITHPILNITMISGGDATPEN